MKKPVYHRDENREIDIYTLPEPVFSLGTFHFRVLAQSTENALDCPKRIGIIGLSDAKKSIVYLFFSDADLNYISEGRTKGEMAKLVQTYFAYDW